ncbi:MAG TPA: peptidase M23 [Alteromonas sp.]|nr:peptidase M23 [Alteromonas sp.]
MKRITPKLMTNLFKQLPRPHRLGLIAASAFVGLLILLPSEHVEASRHTESLVLETGVRYPLSMHVMSQQIEEDDIDENIWQTFKVKRGDTLAKIFKRAGLSPQDTYAVSHAGEQAKTLVTLLPGDQLDLDVRDNQFFGLRYALSATDTLFITPEADGSLTSTIDTKPVEVRYNFAQGEINSSFWNAGVAAGLTDNQIMHLAGIFGWDIDFALDLRKGDEFSVLFEREFVDGEFVGYGKILAAEFVNQGELFQAVLNTENGRYYTPEGRAMRKTFLRSPVNFTYVSSNFNPRRLHPVTGRVRPHNGTDYVAAVGTPVMSAGDGKVIKASYNSLNGNYVFIQHGERYVTKYLHLSRKHVKTGDRVSQGQIIGRVGSTGRVTGAHLHYEFLVNGTHRNPRTVELPKAKSLSESELPAFRTHAQQLVAVLNDNKRIYLAMR